MIVIDKDKTASFDVDPQCGFSKLCPNELPIEEAEQTVPELNLMATFAKYRIISGDLHAPGSLHISSEDRRAFEDVDFPNISKIWPVHCLSGQKGSEFLPGLPHWTTYDFIIAKGYFQDNHPFSAVYTDLKKTISCGVIEWLSYRKIDTILIGGICTEICVKETAIDLVNAGFRVIFNRSAMRSINININCDKMTLEDTKNAQEFEKIYEAGIIIIDNCNYLKLD